MTDRQSRVALVLDDDFGDQLIEQARSCHTWVVRSAKNDAAVSQLRQDRSGYSADTGVTTFAADETAEESFLAIFSTVEEHHGAYSQDPPVSVIEVVGVEPSSAVQGELQAHGFHRVETAPNGFTAYRDSC